MARLKVRTHEITVYFCGKCGKIMPKDIDILSKCPKCSEVIEPWTVGIVLAVQCVRPLLGSGDPAAASAKCFLIGQMKNDPIYFLF